MLELGTKTLIAYLLGTALGSLLLGRMRGVDIRRMGSGNAGATNALRTQGKAFGLAVLLIDIGKGIAAVLWVPGLQLPGIGIDPAVSREWLTLACGLAVIFGHVYPVWFEFRGGKGVATVVGVVGTVQPWLLLPLFATWLVVVVLCGYIGLGSMLAALALCVAVAVVQPDDTPLLGFCCIVAVLVIYTHRANIVRMRAGTESRARRLWLFRPRAA